jgi:hypothetical protein
VFNGHAAAFASLAQTAAASSLGDVADRAWAAARDAYGELADLFVKSAECRPIAYNVVREIDGTLRQDRIEDRRHRNEVSIPMLRLAATQLTEGMLKGTVDLDAARPMVTYLKGAADVLAKTGKLPPESDEDCVRGWAPGWATRIVSFAEQVHRPNRIGFGGPGVRGFTRKLTWRGWGSRVATATGAARVCPNMDRCRIYPVRIRADHRTAAVCDGKPLWLYERLRVRIRAGGRLVTLPASAGGGCTG